MYLDSSALVKLVIDEDETKALRTALEDTPSRVSCALARVEVVRAVRSKGPRAIRAAHELLGRIELIELDHELLDLAAELEAPVRSLDAIHLAAALELGDELEALITYDVRMASAAQALGFRVLAPA